MHFPEISVIGGTTWQMSTKILMTSITQWKKQRLKASVDHAALRMELISLCG